MKGEVYAWLTILSLEKCLTTGHDLQHSLQRPTWEELVNDRQHRSIDRIAHCDITYRLTVP